MKIPHRKLANVLCCVVLLAVCDSQAESIIPKNVPELRPGILAGYLSRKVLPDSLALLPAPPAPGSSAQAADEEAFNATVLLRNTPRWVLAADDAVLSFPKAADAFACAVDAPIGPDTTPHLTILLRRSMVDAGLSTYGAKDHYKRTRPFVANKTPSCSPAEEVALAKDGSYPSGHAALGWAWGLILAEMAPERANALIQRGYEFGQSRVVCGVHWQSDVNQGRVIGAAAVARLHADPVFRAQFDEAAKELADARAKGLKPTGNCASEATALKP
ncbi:MAG: phosphatase PAP2 family protein [Comamonadaceae bacterium]